MPFSAQLWGPAKSWSHGLLCQQWYYPGAVCNIFAIVLENCTWLSLSRTNCKLYCLQNIARIANAVHCHS